MRGCELFLPREFVEKSRVKLRILTRKIIFRAGECPFHHSSSQSHHSNYLKVSKISPTPQTRNSHARPSGGAALKLVFKRSETIYVQRSSDEALFLFHLSDFLPIERSFVPRELSQLRPIELAIRRIPPSPLVSCMAQRRRRWEGQAVGTTHFV